MRDGATVAVIRKAVIGTAAFYAAVVLSCPAHSAETSENSSVLIVDSSNSMWSQIRGRGRFDITRSVLSRNFSTYSGRFDLGIIAYGHRSKTSCSDIQTIMPVGRIEPRKYSRAIRRLTPKGKTPISRALNTAMKVTKSGSPPDNIVLLSDGIDNCGPNPCATAAALNSLHANLRIHVIALSVPPKQQARLRCIAENTGGTFVAARNQPGLASATETVFGLIAEQNEQMRARRLMAMTETTYTSAADVETDPLAPTLSALTTESSDKNAEAGTSAASSAASERKIPIPRANPRTVSKRGSAPNLPIAESVGEPQPFIPTPASPQTAANFGSVGTPRLATMPDIAATPEMLVAPEIVTATKILPATETSRTPDDIGALENTKAVEDTEAREVTAALEVAAAPEVASATEAASAPEAAMSPDLATALEVTAVPDLAAAPRVIATPDIPGAADDAASTNAPASIAPKNQEAKAAPNAADKSAGADAPKVTHADKVKTTKAVAAAPKTPEAPELATVSVVTKPRDTPAAPDVKETPKVAAAPEIKIAPEPETDPAPAPAPAVTVKPAPAKPVIVAANAAIAPATTGAISSDDATGQRPPAKINLGNRPIPRLPDEVRPTFLINEEPTDVGDEGLQLRGQITSATATITRPIDWAAYKVEDAKTDRWRKIASVETAEASISLPPGQYVVRASYGAARAAKVLVVKPGKRIDATFILNAGGLRILPGLAFLDVPKGIAAKHWVFGASANEKGKRRLFAQSSAIGEVVRLNAGTYTLVSRFGSANAVVETNITIRPGTLTEVEINHKVGIVSFRLNAPPKNASGDNAIKWQLVDAKGNIIVRADGKEMVQILAPGSYRIMVEHLGKSYTSEFMVEIGETKAVEIATK